jgi:outer membrane protein
MTAFFCNSVLATNLMDVYTKALESDPQFKAARAEWLATKEGIPIARSFLLPQISATGGLGRSYNKVTENAVLGGNGNFYNNNSNYSLTLTQSLFNYGNMTSLSNAKSLAQSEEATFAAAAQNLMFRVANNYFNVLLKKDILRVTQEKKKSIAEQLRQTQQKYDVGLIPITDLNDAQASYDTVVADEISAKKDLEDAKEQLREITAIKYQQLDGIGPEVPLVSPQPQNIDRWVITAERQNNTLIAAMFTTLAARQNISTKFSGHLPTLSANGSYTYGYNSNSGAESGTETFNKDKTLQAGVTLDVPIFQGGQVSAETNQARYQYQNALHTQEQTHRSVVSNTRQSYYGVISGISKIIADRQEIVSKQSKLRSTVLSYEAGLRTMVDVLQAETDLYDAEAIYYQDQYSYIIETVNLKQLAGTLNSHDLTLINKWLRKLNVSLESDIYKTSIIKTKPTAIPAAMPTNDSANQPEDNNKENKTVTTPTTSANTIINNEKGNAQKYTASEKYLLGINKNHYTILLLTKNNVKNILQFIKRNGLENQAYYYSTINDNGDEVYKLVYGNYDNLEDANKKLNKLASAYGQKDGDFIVIQYKIVQDEINGISS